MVKRVSGVGINDSPESVSQVVNGKQVKCPYYICWSNMIQRCYSEKLQKTRYRSYVGCSVVQDWHSFMSFKSWMIKQDWVGKELDKDLLFPDNKQYGPDTCMFIDKRVNLFIRENDSKRGKNLVGVTFSTRDNCFYTKVSKNGVVTHIGTFQDEEKAHNAWVNAKREIAFELCNSQVDPLVIDALLLRYHNGSKRRTTCDTLNDTHTS